MTGKVGESVRFIPRVAAEPALSQGRAIPPGPMAVYVHIPFCDQRCFFCDFAIVPGRKRNDLLAEKYLLALKAEMAHYRDQLRDTSVSIETIQIGGGTPTYLSADALDDLLTFTLEQYDCHDVPEIIIEGFPSSITAEKLAVFEQFPMLRLNIGIQTFRDDVLGTVGRSHSGSEALRSLAAAKASTIRDIGADIIFGLPGSDVSSVISDLEAVSEAGVDHLALYPLWVYEQTPLESLMRRGRLESLPPADLQEEQHAVASRLLESRGYQRYSAFHYARDETSRHLYGQWQMLANNWIGFGMSAMSHIDGSIWFNDRNIDSYMETIMRKGGPDGSESQVLSDLGRMKFSFTYGLRLREFPAATFADRFGQDIQTVFGDEIQTMVHQGWLTEIDGALSLTQRGMLAIGEIEEFVNGGTEDQ